MHEHRVISVRLIYDPVQSIMVDRLKVYSLQQLCSSLFFQILRRRDYHHIVIPFKIEFFFSL